MTDKEFSIDYSLLSLCAVLRAFDREMLSALTQLAEASLAAFLRSDLVIPSAEHAGTYMLRDDLRANILEQLRFKRPIEGLELHVRAFEYFLSQMNQADSPSRRLDDEANCFYHLEWLFVFLYLRTEWQIITKYTQKARAVMPQSAPHLRQLALYEGFVAVRTMDYDRGAAILTALLDEPYLENDIRLSTLLALGQMQRNLTHYDQALVLYEQLAAFAREVNNEIYYGVALFNKASVYNELDLYEQALKLMAQSLQIFDQEQDYERKAYAYYGVGLNAMYLGRWQFAQEHFSAAITLFEMLHMEATLATSYWSQGFLHHLLGNESESEAAYVRAIQLTQSSQRGEPLVAMDSRLRLGFLYQTQGRYDEALANYQQAIDQALRLRHEHRTSRIHYLRGKVFLAMKQYHEALASYHQAIEIIESLRSATEGDEIKIGLLGTTQQVYESMVLLCHEQGRYAEAFDYVERARSRAFLDTLAKKAPELYEALDQPVATLAEVQSRLPEGALLLEYFTTGALPQGEHLLHKLPPENARLREHLTLPPTILIFAVTRDHFEVHTADLDPNALRPQASDHSPGRHLLRPRLLPLLYEQLIAPVAHLLRDRDLLYLVPHGPLHYVPFAALHSAAGAYLLDVAEPAMARAPSATILLRNCLGRSPRRAEGFLALGYNDREASALLHAEGEARYLAQVMNGQAWAGPEPKSQRLLAGVSQVRWLHVAGHAVYTPRDPLASHLRLGAGDILSARDIMSGLDLSADLVTLSACTSGVTHVVPGDELLGLQRAFLYAGAPAVVCTLWEVGDFVTLLVMEQFYLRLRQGRPAAGALRDAQVAVRTMTGRDLAQMIERWRAEDAVVAALGELPVVASDLYDTIPFADPFHWAPFMLIGRAD